MFLVLDHASGAISYANAGHNAPVLSGGGAGSLLEPTGMALGWFEHATYEARLTTMLPDSSLLLFTDGLPDAMGGLDAELRLRQSMAGAPTLARITALVDPRFNEDDVTIVLITRKTRAG